jgi:ATPase family associated with various cellular activities (AAA)
VKDYTSRLRTDATRYSRLVSWSRPPPRSQLPTSLPFRQVRPLHYTLGPPGSGKTSMARSLAASLLLKPRLVLLSAVSSTVRDLRDAIESARRAWLTCATSLFIDVIHQFSRVQQNALLPSVEDGWPCSPSCDHRKIPLSICPHLSSPTALCSL